MKPVAEIRDQLPTPSILRSVGLGGQEAAGAAPQPGGDAISLNTPATSGAAAMADLARCPIECEFRPITGAGLNPAWFIVRYNFPSGALIERVLDFIGIRFHLFKFNVKPTRSRRDATRFWFPGYIFLNFDPLFDPWQQVYRIPGVLEILGNRVRPAAVDDEIMEDLLRRLGPAPLKNTDETTLAAGITVEIKAGPFAGFRGVVQSSNRKEVSIVLIDKFRPLIARVALKNLQVVS